MSKVADRIVELEHLIQHAAQKYYEGDPEMTDSMFDELVDKMRSLDPTNPILHKIGWGYKPEDHLTKRKHCMIVGSLDKIKHAEVMADPSYVWGNDFIESLKLDGGSGVAYYDENGDLMYVLSRGDGEYGLDITKNVLPGRTIPLKLRNKGIRAVRGEVCLTYEGFDKVGGAHPRNRAVGLSQSVNISDDELQYIKFVAVAIIQIDERYSRIDKYHDMVMLQNNGFLVVPWTYYPTWTEFIGRIKDGTINVKDPSFIELMGGEHLPVDGLVLAKNECFDSVPEDGLQIHDHISIAYKFDNETRKVRVKELEWNLSRTGRMVPTVIYDCVSLSGCEMDRATGNNAKWVSDLGVGALIEVQRGNEVIPNICGVIEKVAPQYPTTCPECGSELKWMGVDLKCVNPDCPRQEWTMVFNLMQWCSPDGLGTGTLNKLYHEFKLYKIEDLARFRDSVSKDDLDRVLGDGHYSKLSWQMVEYLKDLKLSIANVLYIANIPDVGDASQWGLNNGIVIEEFWDCVSLDRVPDKWAKFLANCNSFANLKSQFSKVRRVVEFVDYCNVFKYVAPVKAAVSYVGKIAITGKLSRTKADYEKIFEDLKLEYVRAGAFKKGAPGQILVWDGGRESSQLKAARDAGAEILTEGEFNSRYGLE